VQKKLLSAPIETYLFKFSPKRRYPKAKKTKIRSKTKDKRGFPTKQIPMAQCLSMHNFNLFVAAAATTTTTAAKTAQTTGQLIKVKSKT